MSKDADDKGDNKSPGQKVLEWWNGLQPKTDKSGKVTSPGDPGALARLRRASSPIDALTEEQAIRLAKRLGASLDDQARLARIGALAAVLTHVKTHRDKDDKKRAQHMARQLGPDSKGDNAVMSSLRFQRLIAAREPADLMREMRGAVKLLKGTANIRDIGDAFYWWSDKTRIAWTYDYWGAGDADPDNTAKALVSTNRSDEPTAKEAAS